jgi:DNA-binding response OmpR family regulator
MSRILIIEDEQLIAIFVKKGLRAEGFSTEIALDAERGVVLALSTDFDLIILDLGLPDADGLAVLELLRAQGVQAPVIILTARDDLPDKVAGFEAGADDYLTKPFRFEELLVRIKARLRSRQALHQTLHQTIEIMLLGQGVLQLDLRSHRVKVDSEWIELPEREFNLAEVFFRAAGEVLSREQILDRVWGYDYDPGSNIVDVYVGYLRKKLGRCWIETVRGRGYRLRKS